MGKEMMVGALKMSNILRNLEDNTHTQENTEKSLISHLWLMLKFFISN